MTASIKIGKECVCVKENPIAITYVSPISHTCHRERVIYLSEECNEEIIDIVLNHETIDLLLGQQLSNKFENLFKNTPVEKVTRENVLDIVAEDGTPNF